MCPANWSLDISNGSFLNLSTRGKHLLFFSCDFKHNLENYCALQEKKSNHWIDQSVGYQKSDTTKTSYFKSFSKYFFFPKEYHESLNGY